MKFLKEKNFREYRNAVLFCLFCLLIPVYAQGNTEGRIDSCSLFEQRESLMISEMWKGSQCPETMIQAVFGVSEDRLLYKPAFGKISLEWNLPGLKYASHINCQCVYENNINL